MKRYQWRQAALILPSLAGVMIFVLIPFADVARRSFMTAVTGEFVGMADYLAVFHNVAFRLAAVNTLRFTAVGLPLLLALSLIIALLVNQLSLRQFLKSAYLFPMAVPTAAVVLIWKMLFHENGLLNALLTGLGGSAVDWLGSNASFWVLIFSYVWKNMGYTVVLWLAGLHSIPANLTEAAQVDGASRRQCFFYITLPCLKPALYTITILSFLNSFKIFREAYLVAGAYPQQRMYLLQHLFNNWFTSLEVDKMSAAAVCITILFVIFSLVLQRLWDRNEVT